MVREELKVVELAEWHQPDALIKALKRQKLGTTKYGEYKEIFAVICVEYKQDGVYFCPINETGIVDPFVNVGNEAEGMFAPALVVLVNKGSIFDTIGKFQVPAIITLEEHVTSVLIVKTDGWKKIS